MNLNPRMTQNLNLNLSMTRYLNLLADLHEARCKDYQETIKYCRITIESQRQLVTYQGQRIVQLEDAIQFKDSEMSKMLAQIHHQQDEINKLKEELARLTLLLQENEELDQHVQH
ncbi:hypothetical protein RCL1_000525 [Eukaryota sp. TZLM3-RCL]